MNKKTCLKCLKEKSKSEFYQSFSEWHGDGKIPYCKTCLKNKLDENNLSSIKTILRIIDRPYKKDAWEKAKSNEKETLGIYLKDLALNFKYENYDNSQFFSENETPPSYNDDSLKYDIDNETFSYWGKGYQDWEYFFLEDERIKLMSSFECPDYGMEMIMKDICFINLDIEKLRQEKNPNNQKAITTLIETRSKLMNSANMNPIQATGAEASDQITFGTLIKKWENERPVPKPLDDEMKEYIDTYMVGHLAKMEGLNNELTEKYDKALSNYTIDFNEINKNNEEYDD
ncbi:hypothetical protein CHH83_02605 [Bacillus sp. 7586-K]|nr:hypothetical protein CHH83_02605 [Bacillus sp. 7586-K]